MNNVILLTIDTLRKDVLGCYGHERKLSPFIDSIQDRCIRFTNAQSTGPYTQAGFPGLLTSSYYLEYGYGKDKKKLSPYRVLISEALHKHGIATAAFHSNAYLCDFFGWNRGWDTFYDSMDVDVSDLFPYVDAFTLNKKVSAWLAGRSQGVPFFLWLHYMDMHEPYIPAKKYLDMVDPDLNLSDDEMFSLFKNVVQKRDATSPNTLELLKKLYLAGVPKIDDAVKEIWGILKAQNLLDDTVLILAADHGDEFGEHGGLSHDGKMYKELIDVPLIVFDPALPEGKVADQLVSGADVPPTIMNMFGLPPVDRFEGHSLFPLENYPSKGVYGESTDKHGSKETADEMEVHFYREDNLKIIYNEKGGNWELYDLKIDPQEKTNIFVSHAKSGEMKEKILPRVGRWRK
jgi:arylsulfatase A-like enzyme